MLTDSVKNDNRPKGKHFIGSIIESILRMNASINRNIIINDNSLLSFQKVHFTIIKGSF